MAGERYSTAEEKFTEQRFEFLALARERYSGMPALDELMSRPPQPLGAVVVCDVGELTEREVSEVAAELATGFGVVHVVPLTVHPPSAYDRHPLLRLAERLSTRSPIGIPIHHPMEGHPDAVARFGPPDGTLKIYGLPVERGGARYREQAETNEMFDAHNDGLGYAGLIRTAILMLDSPPIAGGYTFFQNLVRIAPSLAAADPNAYRALFLPDAIRAIRPRGKGAIRVESPVLFLGRDGRPQCFFRFTTGEYSIEWRDNADLKRARTVLERLCAPLGPDSRFVHMTRVGEAVVIANQQIVHGRTPFVDPQDIRGRVLARKWFVAAEEDTAYRHVPGIVVDSRYSQWLPDLFTGQAVEGEWHYDSDRKTNIRIA